MRSVHLITISIGKNLNDRLAALSNVWQRVLCLTTLKVYSIHTPQAQATNSCCVVRHGFWAPLHSFFCIRRCVKSMIGESCDIQAQARPLSYLSLCWGLGTVIGDSSGSLALLFSSISGQPGLCLAEGSCTTACSHRPLLPLPQRALPCARLRSFCSACALNDIEA